MFEIVETRRLRQVLCSYTSIASSMEVKDLAPLVDA